MFRGRVRGRALSLLIKIILLVICSLIIWLTPVFFHLGKLVFAQRNYEFVKVQTEIDWLELRGGIISKIGFVRDADIWLKLNQGHSNGLEQVLASENNNKHFFWLFLLQLQQNKLIDAQKTLNKIKVGPQLLLGQGLFFLVSGDPQQALIIWENGSEELKHLSNTDQTLWHLATAQAESANGQLEQAQIELQKAQKLEPKNPACLTVAFEIALRTGDWDQAVLLSNKIDEHTFFSNPDLLTNQAILAIQKQDTPMFEYSMAELRSIPKGQNYINYVLGIQALSQRDLDQGKIYLSEALQNGLQGTFKTDAQQALIQTKVRLNSEKGLRPIILGNGE